MTKVTIHVAKTNLSKLIAKVEAGEEVTICRGDVEVAKLVPPTPANDTAKAARVPGRFKGRFPIDERFFEALPEDFLGASEE